MTATERVRAMLGNKTVGFVGACGWMHTPEVDRKSAAEFSGRIIKLTDHSRWDFIKIMPNGVYNQEAYGADITYLSQDIPLEKLKTKSIMSFNSYLINSVEDMQRFATIDVARNKVYQREVSVVKALSQHYKGTVPIIPTLFTPAHTIPEFCGGIPQARYYMDKHPQAVDSMLKALLQTHLQLLDAYIDAGADGFFIANRYGNSDIMSKDEFQRFCYPYDQAIINHIKNRTWFNILHVHGEKNFFWEIFKDYQVQAFSWENIPHQVPIGELSTVEKVRAITDKILITGTDQFFDYYGTQKEVKARFKHRLQQAAKEAKDNRLIFAPGCSLPLDIAEKTVHLLREVTDEYNHQQGDILGR